MKIVFATWLFDRTLGESLTKLKVNSRLLSYHFVREAKATKDDIEEYVETGKLDQRKTK